MEQEAKQPLNKTWLFAWVMTLLLSTLPTIVWQEFFGPPNMTLFWAKIILLIVLLVLSFFWKPAKQLRLYFLFILLLFGFEELFDFIGRSDFWLNWFPQSSTF